MKNLEANANPFIKNRLLKNKIKFIEENERNTHIYIMYYSKTVP